MKELTEIGVIGEEMDNALAEMLEDEERLETLTTEIKTIQRQTQQIVLTQAAEIGRRLKEIKSILPHGKWGEYIRRELDYSQSTANNLMRVYEQLGTQQDSLFGGGTETLGDLSYTKVLRLLTLPEQEREEFVEAHDVKSMSTRELEQALKEREAEKAALASDMAIERAGRLTAENAAEAARRKQAALEKKLKELEDGLAEAGRKKAEAEKALEAAKNDPQIPESVMRQLREETQLEASRQAEQSLREAQAATRLELDAALRRAEEAERKALQADPDIARASVYLAGVQEQFAQLCKCIGQLSRAGQPEKAKKLAENVRQKLIGGMSAQLARLEL